jgi:hypothetical protein
LVVCFDKKWKTAVFCFPSGAGAYKMNSSPYMPEEKSAMKELGDKKEAVRTAVKYCRDHDILKTFLEKHTTSIHGRRYQGPSVQEKS